MTAKKEIKTIGVLTSGGDAPGMNAAIRAVVRRGLSKGIKMKGILKGYDGLMNEEIIDMTARDVSDTIERGGTILYTARCAEMRTPEGQKRAADVCRKHGIDGLVVIGGDGSFAGAQKLAALGINTVGVPGTIDLDIACTEYTIGFDTAVNTAMEAIDKVRDTSTSHERCSIIEVMGRNAGYIALWCGIANGAEDILLPEKYDYDEQKIINNIIENRRKGKVRLINGAGFYEKMRKGLGNKRNMISPENRAELVRLYSTYEPDENYMDLDNEDFGYRKIVIERPLLDEDGTPVIDRKGNRKADASLRDYEMVPLKEDIHEYFRREVLPFVPDAWIDESKTKIGYEIPFTRYFYKFTPLRDSSVIMEDIRALEERIQASLAEVLAE